MGRVANGLLLCPVDICSNTDHGYVCADGVKNRKQFPETNGEIAPAPIHFDVCTDETSCCHKPVLRSLQPMLPYLRAICRPGFLCPVAGIWKRYHSWLQQQNPR